VLSREKSELFLSRQRQRKSPVSWKRGGGQEERFLRNERRVRAAYRIKTRPLKAVHVKGRMDTEIRLEGPQPQEDGKKKQGKKRPPE